MGAWDPGRRSCLACPGLISRRPSGAFEMAPAAGRRGEVLPERPTNEDEAGLISKQEFRVQKAGAKGREAGIPAKNANGAKMAEGEQRMAFAPFLCGRPQFVDNPKYNKGNDCPK
jgi:hypothetical protein